MTGDFTFAHDVRVAIGRLMRLFAGVCAGVWLGIAVIEGVRVLGGPAVDLSAAQRTVAIAFAAAPALCYVLALYLGMGSFGWRFASARTLAMVFSGLLLLLVAPVHVAWRYRLGFVAQTACGVEVTALVGLGFAALRFGDDQMSSVLNVLTVPVRAVRLFMWDIWRWADCSEDTYRRIFDSVGGVHESQGMGARGRRPMYTEERTLRCFQSSHTCSVVDAHVMADQITVQLTGRRMLTMLDIGGGEGTFTRHLLARLAAAGHKVSRLDMIDPAVGMHDDYAQSVRGVFDTAELRMFGLPFEASTELEPRYDLVVAAHSLYAVLDAARNEDDAGAVLDRLNSLSQGGLLAVILASASGVSYRFKSDALRLVTGDVSQDTTAESFRAHVREIPALEGRIHRWTTVDNVIDVTDYLTDALTGFDDFRSWVSYFIRVPARELDRRTSLSLMALARMHAVPFGSLGVAQAASARQDATKAFGDTSLVLSHRSIIGIWE